jgi:hypothetical protein
MRPVKILPLLLLLVIAGPSFGSDTKQASNKDGESATKPTLPPELQGHGPVTKQTRLELIRTMEAEFGFAKTLFPKGTKGIEVTSGGAVTPDEQTVTMAVATYGPAAKPGDRVQITNVLFKDHSMVFELNGGAKKKGHWYDHVEVGGGGGMVPVHQEKQANAKGSYIALVFPKYVPEMTATDVKKMLDPVIDFTVKSPTQAYLDTLPPKLKETIENHQALVGMNKDMVMEALGRPPKRVREHDGASDYEEWIYGQPPGEMQFVRFINEEVVRVEHIQVGSEKVVKTEREVKVNPVSGRAVMIDPNAPQTASAASDSSPTDQQGVAPTQTAQAHKPKPPSMKRPGEQTTLEQMKKVDAVPELGSKPIPTSGQQPEWGTKPATPGTPTPDHSPSDPNTDSSPK